MELVFILFPMLFLLVFGLLFGCLIALLIRNDKQNRVNNHSLRLTSEATVITKRTKVWGDHSRTTYFATFQFESGDRLEVEIPHNQFGYLVEGDKGKLGTRYLSFERT